MRDGRKIQAAFDGMGVTHDDIARRTGMSPGKVTRVIEGRAGASLDAENQIRTLAGYDPLRQCPTCDGKGRVGGEKTDADPVLHVQRLQANIAGLQGRHERLRRAIREGEEKLAALRDGIDEALTAETVDDARAALRAALADIEAAHHAAVAAQQASDAAQARVAP
jgi:transcriptional regulator with XRE-family HTH domain